MEEYLRNRPLEYWLSVPQQFRQALYKLRKWPELKLATEGNLIWIQGFSEAEIESASTLEIPLIERYYLREARLYPVGKSLPARVAPSLLWTPLERGLKVSLPPENFNYFGLRQSHRIVLVPSAEERQITATIVSLAALGTYLYAAPRVRTERLSWSVLGHYRAIVLGTPLLPVRGQDFYQIGSFLIPAGWAFQYPAMASVYERALGGSGEFWFLVNEENETSKIRKSAFNQLSKGSFISTFPKHE